MTRNYQRENIALPNKDLQEIAKFEALGSDWWNINGEMKLLHQLNPLRLQYIQGTISLKNKKVLDIGCGGGILAEAMAKAGAEVTGIDLSERTISIAQEHASLQNLPIDYKFISAEELAVQSPHNYDVIICMEMLEHVPDPSSIIKACSLLLKENGFAFFSTIHRNIKSFLQAIIGAEYILNLLPKGTHHYAKFIRPSELSSWARLAQLEIMDIRGINYSNIHQGI